MGDHRTTLSALGESVAIGAFVGVVAAAHDVFLKSGDLTGNAATFLTRGAMAAVVYTALAVALTFVMLLVTTVATRGRIAELESGGPLIWWLAVAAMGLLSLALPAGGRPVSRHLLAYLALIPIAALGCRSLRLASGAGAHHARPAASFAGGLVALLSLFVATRAASAASLAPGALAALAVGGATVLAAVLATLALRALFDSLSRRTGPPMAFAPVVGPVAAIVLLAAAGGLVRELEQPDFADAIAAVPEVSRTGDDRPSVILLSVDALRRDFVGYAGGRPRTPTLDAIAEQSWVFDNAYSVAPWTRPSFAAFFTGRYPSEVGVARAPSLYGSLDRVIPVAWSEDAPVLAELLRDEGYLTGAVVTNPHLAAHAGADRGFQAFHHCTLAGMRRFRPHDIGHAMDVMLSLGGCREPSPHDFERASVVTTRGVKLLEALARSGGPVLAWLHYMDPHDPYDAPDAPPEEVVRVPVTHTKAGGNIGSAVERAQVIDAYAAEVEYFDRWFGPVIEALRRTGLWERSIVVVWSDHGEEFWEHGSWGHGQSLYSELLGVPLLVHLPGQTEGRRVGESVSLLDVAPTLLELCAAPVPREMRGRSLAPVFEGRPEDLEPTSLYLEGCLYGGVRKGLMRGGYKLIRRVYSDTCELYDLRADPGELTNIYNTPLAPDTAPMRADLERFTEVSLAAVESYTRTARATQTPDEIRDTLRDMGYIQ